MEFRYEKSPVEIERDKKKAKWISNATKCGVPVALLLPLPFVGMLDWYIYVIIFFSSWGDRLAPWICRRAGVSQEIKQYETITRSAGAAMAPFMEAPPAFTLGKLKSPRARVSREGIEHPDWRGTMKLIPWQQIESCSLDTSLDAVGNRVSECFAIFAEDGSTLAQICVSDKQAETLLPAIRFYLRGEETTPQVLGGAS